MRIRTIVPEPATSSRAMRWNLHAQFFWKAIGIASLLGVLTAFPGIAHADNWALLIGIDQYEDANRINPLGAAGADAKALAKTLHDRVGFADDHIQLLVSDGDRKPNRSNIIRALSLLAANTKPGDTVLVFYSGHGVEIAGTPYVLPFDTSAMDQDTLTATAISVPDFQARLGLIKSKALILAFDMSRNDPGKNTRELSPLDNKPAGEGIIAASSPGLERKLDFNANISRSTPIMAMLFSCTPNQRSYEWQEKGRGYFSYYLEQGLLGKAADGSGRVTVRSLANYVTQQVTANVDRKEHRQQTPYTILDGSGAESFVLEEATVLSLVPAVLEDAKRSAGNITDAANKSCALRNIALSQYESEDLIGARATLTLAQGVAENIADAAKKSLALSSIAVVQVKVGDVAQAQATLSIARAVAQSISDAYQRSEALREVAEGIIAMTKATK